MKSIETTGAVRELNLAALPVPGRGRSSLIASGLGFVAAVLALASGCSPAPMPVATSTRDPSNAASPEGVTPAVAASSVSARPEGRTPTHHHPEPSSGVPAASAGDPKSGTTSAFSADAGSVGAVYVCPMHPEVTSGTAGLCPKCNMKLVPKK